MHIPPFDNQNAPIVAAADPKTPLVYFNRLMLKAGESITSQVEGYETCLVPATGTVDVSVGAFQVDGIGGRGVDVWDGEPSGVYVPSSETAEIEAKTDAEVFVAGARFDDVYAPFAVRPADIDPVQ